MEEAGAKFDLDARCEDTCTALEIAIIQRKLRDVRLLLKYSANANLAHDLGVTPFMLACYFDEPIAFHLLAQSKQKIDLDTRDKSGRSAVAWAAVEGKSARLVHHLLFRHGVTMLPNEYSHFAAFLNMKSTPEVRMVYAQYLRLRGKAFLDTRSATASVMPLKAGADITGVCAEYLVSDEYQQMKSAFVVLNIQQNSTSTDDAETERTDGVTNDSENEHPDPPAVRKNVCFVMVLIAIPVSFAIVRLC